MGNLLPSWLFSDDAFEESENDGFEEIAVVGAFNLIVAAGFMSYFTYKRWKHPDFFSPKPGPKPPELKPPQEGFCSWVMELARISDADFLHYAGLDALVFIRFYLLCAKIFVAFTLYAWAIIIPINATDDYYKDNDADINSFSRISMANISPGSPRMWVHVVGFYLLTLISFYFLNGDFMNYTRLRHEYLRLGTPQMRTIMLEAVPEEMRSNSKLRAYFNVIYKNQVVNVTCTQDLRPLGALLAKREKVLDRLEAAMVAKETGESGMLIALKCWKSGGEEVDAASDSAGEEGNGDSGTASGHGKVADALLNELNALNQEISRQQGRKLTHIRQMEKDVLAPIILVHNENGVLDQQLEPAIPLVWPEADMGPVEHYVQTCLPSESGVRRRRPQEGERKGSGGGAGWAEEEEDAAELQPTWSERFMEGLRAVHRGMTHTSALGGRRAEPGEEGSEEMLLPKSPYETPRSRGSFSRTEDTDIKMAPKAYVTFKTFTAASTAMQVHHGSLPGRLAAVQAPEPRDIYWQNTYMSLRTRFTRRLVVDMLLLLLFIFYVVPVTLLYFLLSKENLMSKYSWINSACNKSSLFSSMISTLQPLSLLALMSTLPPLIRVLGMVEGCAAESKNQLLGLSRYFIFQIINVFLVTVTAGSVIDSIDQILNDPKKTFTLLGEALPKVCGYFSEYILIKWFSGLAIEISGFVRLVQHYILLLIWPQDTPRQRSAVVMGMRPYVDPGWFNYSKIYAQDLLVVVVTFTYACINPFILVVSIPYYLNAYLVYKHQFLYVYYPIYQTGGAFYPKVFRRMVFAILIGQATMIGVLLLKKGYWQAGTVFLLMILTWVFKGQERSMYEPAAETLPMEIAVTLDYNQKTPFSQDQNKYLQPELRAEATINFDADELSGTGSGGGAEDEENK